MYTNKFKVQHQMCTSTIDDCSKQKYFKNNQILIRSTDLEKNTTPLEGY